MTDVGIDDIKHDRVKNVFIIKYHIGSKKSVKVVKNDANKDKNISLFTEKFRELASDFIVKREKQKKSID